MALVLLDEKYLGFTVTWEFYQRVIEGRRTTPASEGYQRIDALIDTVKSDVPPDLPELRTLGKTLHQRRDDILAYFRNPGTSNGPTEAINEILEHLRGTARGFRNLTNYIARCPLDAGGFRPLLHSLL